MMRSKSVEAFEATRHPWSGGRRLGGMAVKRTTPRGIPEDADKRRTSRSWNAARQVFRR